MRISEATIRRIIREEIKDSSLKKVNWENFNALSTEERAVFNKAMQIFRPALQAYTASMTTSASQPNDQRNATNRAADDEFLAELARAAAVFTEAGLEPVKSITDTIASMENSKAIRARRDAPTEKKLVMVAIRDEKGNLVRVPELEALKYFQAQAAEMNRKADEAEADLIAKRKEYQQELSDQGTKSRETMKKNHELELARSKKTIELGNIFSRVSMRIVKQAMRLKQSGKEGDVQAMIKLGNVLTAAHSAGDEAKMLQLDQNTEKWGIDEARRRHLREGASAASVFNRIKDICEEALMNKSLGMKPAVATRAADRVKDALKDI